MFASFGVFPRVPLACKILFAEETLKVMKELIQQFNKRDTVLVISDYPHLKGKEQTNYGIAWFTKLLTDDLAKKYKRRFVVVGHKNSDNTPKLYNKNNCLVLRIFEKNHKLFLPQILIWLLKFNRAKTVDVHSEFATNGGITNFIFLFPFLLMIKLSGKKLRYFAHNVVIDLISIAPHLGFKKESLTIKILNKCLRYYYLLLNLVIDDFIVMDEAIYNRLSLFIDPKKIYFYPLPLKKTKNHLTNREARKKLRFKNKEFILLYFGFITYYKGADLITKLVKELVSQKNFSSLKLVMAGGEAHSLKDQRHYQDYYKGLVDSVKKDRNIAITGFVPEKDIPVYFKAADAVVIPYRGLIGSSATLSHTIAFNKPFIISLSMKDIFQNKDFAKAFKKESVSPKDIMFDNNFSSFKEALLRLQKRPFSRKIIKITKELAQERNKSHNIEGLYSRLYAKN